MWESCPRGADLLIWVEAQGLAQGWFPWSVKGSKKQNPREEEGRGLDGAADSEAARPPKFREFMSVGPCEREKEWPTYGSVLSDK